MEFIKFPEDSEFSEFTLVDKKHEGFNKEFIEVLLRKNNKYIVTSPSRIGTGEYRILEDNIEILKMKPVTDMEKTLLEAFIKAGFIFDSEGFEKYQRKKYSEHYELTAVPEDLSELTEHFMLYYEQGQMNNTAFPLICNLRRAGWSKDDTNRFFKNLPINQDMGKIRSYINNKYGTNIKRTAGFKALSESIKEFCKEEHQEKVLSFFGKFFNYGGEANIINRFKEYKSDSYLIDRNILFIKYESDLWIDKVKTKNGKTLDLYENDNCKDFYLAVQCRNEEFSYVWTSYQSTKSLNFTKTFDYFLDKFDPERNKFIKRKATEYDVTRARGSIDKFLNILSSLDIIELREMLEHNDKICNILLEHRLHNQRNGVLFDDVKIDDSNVIRNDKEKNQICRVKIKTKADGEIEESIEDIYTNFSILSFTKKKSLIKDTEEFEIELRNGKKKKFFKFTDMNSFADTIDNIPGYSMCNKTELKRSCNGIINHLFSKNKVKELEYNNVDGIFKYRDKDEFFLVSNGEIIEIKKPTEEQLQFGIDVIKDLYDVSPIKDKSKLNEIFRWFLIAPWSYTFRKEGIESNFVPFLYLYGTRDTAKTSNCKVSGMMWCSKGEVEAGSFANTEYRLGEAFKKDGLPKVIDECGDLFKLPFVRDMIKTMHQNTYSRKKQIGDDYTPIDCYSNGTFTSNDELPFTHESIIKRFKIIHFSHEDIATEDDKELFKETFDMENGGYKNSRFKNLKYIGDAFFHYCNEHFKEIMNNYGAVLDSFIADILGLEHINVRHQEIDTIESITENYKEAVIHQLLSDYYQHDRVNLNNMISEDIEKRVHENIDEGIKAIAKSRRIDYLYYTIDKDGDECIMIHNRINRVLKDNGYSFDDMTGKKLADLFGSKDIHKVNGKSISGAKIKITDLESLMNI